MISSSKGCERILCNFNENIFKIISKKHDGNLHRRWEKNFLFHKDDYTLIGGNNQTVVTEVDGKTWCTKDPALFYFPRDKWYNVIIIFEEGRYFYYCNISSPFTWRNNSLIYIDYDIDIVVEQDYHFKIVDEQEYEQNKMAYHYPKYIDDAVKNAKNQLTTSITMRRSPFNETFISKWKDVLFNLNNSYPVNRSN